MNFPNHGPATPPDWLRDARTHGFISRLSDRLVADLIAGAHRVVYPAGGIGLRWDDDPKAAIVLRGAARGFLIAPDGSQVTTRYLRPGDMTGVFADREPRFSRGVQALEPCELLIIEADQMKAMSMAHPQFAWALVEELTTVLNTTHRALYLRAFGSVKQRIAVALLDRAAAERVDRIAPGTVVVGTQSELAQGAGTVREVVALTLQTLRGEGIIEVHRGRVVIVDPVRLSREANGDMQLGLPA